MNKENNLLYSEDFNKLIEISIEHNEYVGCGNPNAKMLFIGKELGIEKGKEIYHGFGISWRDRTHDYSERINQQNIEDKKLLNGNHTWQKYQKLYDIIVSEYLTENIIKEKEGKYGITFLENVFTTELSNITAPNTKDAKQDNNFRNALKERKKYFWNSNYFNQFPIILIFGSDNKYIETYQGEVCELFDVTFSLYKSVVASNLWIHYAKKNVNQIYPRLLIHTRQLTNGAPNELLNEIAFLVKQFIKEHSLNIIVK
ncbi:MAG: hypothetical protein JW870_21750 [Candidatus Delongbacteria bacterium]|nr:hypothetical protein [Candidatus Delongbacteria bacterium]